MVIVGKDALSNHPCCEVALVAADPGISITKLLDTEPKAHDELAQRRAHREQIERNKRDEARRRHPSGFYRPVRLVGNEQPG